MSTPTQLENEIARGGPIGVTDPSGNRTLRKVMIPYEYGSLTDIKRALCGYTSVDAMTGQLIRYAPYKDPDAPDQRVNRCEHLGYIYRDRFAATDDEVPFFTGFKPEKWVLSLTFSSIPYLIGSETYLSNTQISCGSVADETVRWMTKDVRPDREYVIPPRGIAYQDGVQLSIPVPTVIPFSNIEITWLQVPISPVNAYPRSAIEDCLGKISSDDLPLPLLPDGVSSAPAGTMHLLGVRPQIVYQVDGTLAADISFSFRQRSMGWNTFPNALGQFRPVTRGPGGGAPGFFEETEFGFLFKTQQQWEAA